MVEITVRFLTVDFNVQFLISKLRRSNRLAGLASEVSQRDKDCRVVYFYCIGRDAAISEQMQFSSYL